MMPETNTDRREMTLRAKLSLPETASPPWSTLTALLAVFVMLICLIVVGPALASLLLGGTDVTPFLLILSWTLGMALTIAFVTVNRRSSAESWRALQLHKGRLPLPIVMLIGVAIGLAIDLIVSLASGQFLPVPEILGFQTRATASLALAALLLVILQPLGRNARLSSCAAASPALEAGTLGRRPRHISPLHRLAPAGFLDGTWRLLRQPLVWHYLPRVPQRRLLLVEGLYWFEQRRARGQGRRRAHFSADGRGTAGRLTKP